MNASAPYYDEEGSEQIPKQIKSPALPYVGEIPGGLFPGRAIFVKGSVLRSDDCKRFVVELCCGLLVHGDHQDNKALHFNPRFETSTSWFSGKGDHQIVLNSLVNNRWGTEERYANVFKEGQPFTLRILVLAEYFKVAVNGKHLCDYLYRIGINDVQTLFISGNVHIDLIEFQGEEHGSPGWLENGVFIEPRYNLRSHSNRPYGKRPMSILTTTTTTTTSKRNVARSPRRKPQSRK